MVVTALLQNYGNGRITSDVPLDPQQTMWFMHDRAAHFLKQLFGLPTVPIDG
jgi:hypothetical protein